MLDIKKIKKYDVVSFDIFDTLIKRNVQKASDVFTLIEKIYNKNEYNISDFVENRIKAEKIARNNKKINEEDITIDDIYSYLNKIYDEKICCKLKKIEIDTEMKICQQNKEMKKLYDYCIKNKEVIITSDMYLPKDVIEEILKTNGFDNYKKLYLSSEIKKTKSSGNLYHYIINDLRVEPNKIIHIGDNKKSDYRNPKEIHINSVLYKSKKLNKKFYNIEKNILESFIYNNISSSNDYYYNFGYKNMGPILCGFCKWLHKSITNDKIKNIYFLSRDGKIMKTAYDILYSNMTYYVYASRRSLIVPSLWKAKEVNEFYTMMNLPKNIKLKHLLNRFGIDTVDSNILKNYNLDLEKEYNLEALKKDKNFIDLMELLKDDIIKQSKREYDNLNKYLQKNIFNKQIAIVDIGWFGSMQQALERLFDFDITGYYMGIHTRKKTQTDKMHGFLFETNKNKDMDEDEYLFNSILEFIFSTFHGSVKSFGNDGKVELYEYEYNNMKEKDIIKSIQDGSITFVKDIKESNMLDILELNEEISSCFLFKTCLKPKYVDSVNLGKLKILDNGIMYIGADKGLMHYIFHPKKFFQDFKKSTWKIGFLKRIFIIPINYYKLIKKYKNIMNG